MNIDFHFYGTFASAMLAGFTKEEATDIAYSAEFVDEYTDEVIADCGMAKETATPTCIALAAKNYPKELMKSNIEHSKIWMPFHFLPAFCRKYYLDRGSKVNPEKLDFMCRPNGTLIQPMLQRYSLKDLPAGTERLRSLVGIGMNCHIYADTWAHADFAGIHSQELNGVSGDATEISDPHHPIRLGLIYYDEQATKPFALGHGALGHLPDYSDKWINYYPSWLKDAPIKAYARCNQDGFYDAFIAMTDYLSRVRTGGYTPLLDKSVLDLIKQMMKGAPEYAELKWKNFIRDICGIDMGNFLKNLWINEYRSAADKTKTHLYWFDRCAKTQQKYVMEKIDTKKF